ncbi:GumC family protein [Zhouia sp. PK063]|uniref:GumC family protein n=1 Tax=Zhouia sp. PK063 TaxID=3373602 RepID=UPI00378E31A3
MLDQEFDIRDIQSTFDFRGFVFRVLSYWYVVLICVIIALGIARYMNKRAVRVYRLSTLISVKDENNPFFSSSMNLTFNWGGSSDKVETIKTILSSRSHNEDVVRLLQSYIHYLKQGEFRLEDVHKEAPFIVDIDEQQQQLMNVPIEITFIDDTHYKIHINSTPAAQLINYTNDDYQDISVANDFEKTYAINDTVHSSFFHLSLKNRPSKTIIPGEHYYIQFTDINSEISKFQGIDVREQSAGSTLLSLSLTGTNRAILADYLNATVELLKIRQLEQKNQFATNTIKFIDDRIARVSDSLKKNEKRLKEFRQDNQIFDLSSKGSGIYEKLSGLEEEKNTLEVQKAYLNQLENYLETSASYTNLPAPASAGVEDPNIELGIGHIVELSVQRSSISNQVKSPIFFKKIDKEIDATKKVLLENIKNVKSKVDIAYENTEQRMQRVKYEYGKLPAEEQQLFNIERWYKLSETSYSTLLEKRNEASIVKAANVSDVKVIDKAKDMGQGPILPNTKRNNMVFLLGGFIVPLTIILIISFLDNKIHTQKDIEYQTNIPVLGVIGRSKIKGNLAVLDKTRSAIAEAFRGLRSGLQYFYRSKNISGSKTLMITSSISGEGKTFCSINMASVFALSGKKTLLLGLDLRRPRIFEDFNINNEVGAVNYLIGELSLSEIIQSSGYDNLDIITSGPVPPNPSELIIGEQMEAMIKELKMQYDYIIMDTPPIGLVADALELVPFADVTLFVARQEYTRKGMLKMINDKYEKGEIKHVCLVLNDFKTKLKNGYGYGYGYGYTYGKGYHEEEKKSWYKRFFK